nr:RpiB/LacA/LacB family sugar-phosphate isomerase [Maliibacterium massiliense]
MKVILGADRGGFALKEAVKQALIEKGYDVTDATPQEVLFQDAARAVAGPVSRGEYDRGIAMCGTGMGVSIVCNKHRGVYAALCESVFQARRAKVVNNTNVLCMGGMIVGPGMGIEMALQWLEAEHMQGIPEERWDRLSKEFQALVDFEAEAYGDKK